MVPRERAAAPSPPPRAPRPAPPHSPSVALIPPFFWAEVSPISYAPSPSFVRLEQVSATAQCEASRDLAESSWWGAVGGRGRRDPFPESGVGRLAPGWSPAEKEQRTRAAWSSRPLPPTSAAHHDDRWSAR